MKAFAVCDSNVSHTLSGMTKVARRLARSRTATCVVIYARVSTEEQAASGAGLDAQVAECRAYAERHGWEVVEVIREEPVSGKVQPNKRPGFARAVARLDDCEAGTLLVRRMDRVSRRLRHTLSVIDDADAAGWALATTDGKVDTATAAGRFQLNIMAAAAEYEREVIGERTREGLAAKRAAGVRLGRPPAVLDEVLRRMLAEQAAGRSLRAIAAGLTDDQVPTARGGPQWSHATVQSVLASERATRLRENRG